MSINLVTFERMSETLKPWPFPGHAQPSRLLSYQLNNTISVKKPTERSSQLFPKVSRRLLGSAIKDENIPTGVMDLIHEYTAGDIEYIVLENHRWLARLDRYFWCLIPLFCAINFGISYPAPGLALALAIIEFFILLLYWGLIYYLKLSLPWQPELRSELYRPNDMEGDGISHISKLCCFYCYLSAFGYICMSGLNPGKWDICGIIPIIFVLTFAILPPLVLSSLFIPFNSIVVGVSLLYIFWVWRAERSPLGLIPAKRITFYEKHAVVTTFFMKIAFLNEHVSFSSAYPGTVDFYFPIGDILLHASVNASKCRLSEELTRRLGRGPALHIVTGNHHSQKCVPWRLRWNFYGRMEVTEIEHKDDFV